MGHLQIFLPTSMSKCAYEKDIDVSHMRGNASTETKRFCLAILHFFVGTKSTSFGADIGQNLNWVEMNIHEENHYTYAETIFNITIEKEMCNVRQILHGACAAYMVDLCTVASLVTLGTAQGFDGTGVSQSMNLVWHRAIRLRTVEAKKSKSYRIPCLEKLWADDKLCISATHSTVIMALIFNDKTKAKL
ncbi:hypothetical protein CVT25_005530 [Psilocybe cyanescens]|uniref:Thioesterase domain-containing protein n=1 Tax=Psilocybe cyanescens TaxID=93625 RepID=A0A409VQQ8_PSICY|nr:hypothetical protein CVT25_005530 [Psilocybe cyanescens]